MAYNESNNSFYSWEGTINRKDYVINMLILIALFFALNLVRFDILAQNKILYTILMFIIGFLKFIFIMSVLSVIYRRIADTFLYPLESLVPKISKSLLSIREKNVII